MNGVVTADITFGPWIPNHHRMTVQPIRNMKPGRPVRMFFSRMLPVVRTFISLPAGFAHVDMKKFLTLTFLGSLPWTALILFAGMVMGKGWQKMLAIGHQASLIFVAVCAVIIAVMYLRYRKRKQAQAKMEVE